jgi:hypothetical protein
MSTAIDAFAKVLTKNISTGLISTENITLNGAEPELTLRSSANVIADSNLVVNKNLTVLGETNFKSNVVIDGDLSVTGAFALPPTLSATDFSTTNLVVTGETTLVTVSATDITVTGDANLNNVAVTGTASFDDLTVGGDLVVEGNLRVASLVSDTVTQESTVEKLNIKSDGNSNIWYFEHISGSTNLGLYYDGVLKFEFTP